MTESKAFSDYMTIKEAASAIGVPTHTLRYWDDAGKLRAYRHPMNGYRLYKRDDLRGVMRKLASIKKRTE